MPLLLWAAGCTWIPLTEAGAEVRQATVEEVQNCRMLGTVRAKTQDRVVLERGRGKVAEELIVMARNEAAELGGNAVVPTGPPVEGKQAFDVYLCK